jgi:hypothetical protein
MQFVDTEHLDMKKNSQDRKRKDAREPVKRFSDGKIRLNMRQACRFTGLSYGQLYVASMAGRVECYQAAPGSSMFFEISALRKLMDRRKEVKVGRPKGSTKKKAAQ